MVIWQIEIMIWYAHAIAGVDTKSWYINNMHSLIIAWILCLIRSYNDEKYLIFSGKIN